MLTRKILKRKWFSCFGCVLFAAVLLATACGDDKAGQENAESRENAEGRKRTESQTEASAQTRIKVMR